MCYVLVSVFISFGGVCLIVIFGVLCYVVSFFMVFVMLVVSLVLKCMFGLMCMVFSLNVLSV